MANYTPAEKMKLIEDARNGLASPYVVWHVPNQLYSHPTDAYPSLGWGFLLYAVRHHMHRAPQAKMARIIGIRQEYISRMERGQMRVPQTVRTWLVNYILERLEDGKELPLPKGAIQPNRNARQRDLMKAHGTFGGKGKKRKVA